MKARAAMPALMMMACWLLTNYQAVEICGTPETPSLKVKQVYQAEKPKINNGRYKVIIPGQAAPEYWPVASTELKPVPEDQCP